MSRGLLQPSELLRLLANPLNMDFKGLRLTPYEQSVFYGQSLHSFGKQAYVNEMFPKKLHPAYHNTEPGAQ
ncbi:hypothetical protein AYJ56_20710 [Brucella anthropi]|nr:hypothetical protein AYJ56_20710 [Brucella anthropi]